MSKLFGKPATQRLSNPAQWSRRENDGAIRDGIERVRAHDAVVQAQGSLAMQPTVEMPAVHSEVPADAMSEVREQPSV